MDDFERVVVPAFLCVGGGMFLIGGWFLMGGLNGMRVAWMHLRDWWR